MTTQEYQTLKTDSLGLKPREAEIERMIHRLSAERKLEQTLVGLSAIIPLKPELQGPILRGKFLTVSILRDGRVKETIENATSNGAYWQATTKTPLRLAEVPILIERAQSEIRTRNLNELESASSLWIAQIRERSQQEPARKKVMEKLLLRLNTSQSCKKKIAWALRGTKKIAHLSQDPEVIKTAGDNPEWLLWTALPNMGETRDYAEERVETKEVVGKMNLHPQNAWLLPAEITLIETNLATRRKSHFLVIVDTPEERRWQLIHHSKWQNFLETKPRIRGLFKTDEDTSEILKELEEETKKLPENARWVALLEQKTPTGERNRSLGWTEKRNHNEAKQEAYRRYPKCQLNNLVPIEGWLHLIKRLQDGNILRAT